MGTVPPEAGTVACFRKATHAQRLPRDLGNVFPHVDGYTQARVLGRKVDKADDRVSGLDSKDNHVARSLSEQEAGWDAVVSPDVEEVEWTAKADWPGIVDQICLQEHPEVQWVIQKIGAFPAVAVGLYHQFVARPRSVQVQDMGLDLNEDLVKVRPHLVVDSGMGVCDSDPRLVSLIGYPG